jgi:phosphoribosylformylglycinamidine synthase subunit PurS
MIFTAQIKVMPLKNLLDPQGKAVMGGLASLGITGVNDVRIGKQIDLTIEAENETAAREKADEAAKKLLANAVMEMYEITVGS